jgi:hypothetical protein
MTDLKEQAVEEAGSVDAGVALLERLAKAEERVGDVARQAVQEAGNIEDAIIALEKLAEAAE